MLLRNLRRYLQPSQPMPDEMRQNFVHFVMDIGWFGVLNATTLAFLSVYATRIHARPEQIGFLNAVPALMTMFLSLPSGTYLEKRSILKSVNVLGIVHRSFYFFLVLIPFVVNQQRQIDFLLALTFLMYIPYSAFSLSFNSLFGAAVPIEWRGYFAGTRNALFAVVTILISLVSGFLLKALTFPLGYQVVFGMGFVGAMMSSYHLSKIRIPGGEILQRESQIAKVKIPIVERIRLTMRIEVLRGPFLRVLLVLTAFHFTQYLPVPLFPIYNVNVLGLSDQVISIGTAVFYASMFIGSLQHSRLVGRFGNRWVVGVGMILLATYPAILSLSKGPGLYLVANIFGGSAWSLCGTALFNYLLESVPADNRPVYLAWFSLLANFGALAGSLLGPVVSNAMGIVAALILFAALRAASGVAILRWG